MATSACAGPAASNETIRPYNLERLHWTAGTTGSGDLKP